MAKDIGELYGEFRKRELLCHQAYVNDLKELDRNGEELSRRMVKLMMSSSGDKKKLATLYAKHLRAMIELKNYIKHMEELASGGVSE